jgi:hypothetical protein
MTSIPETRTRLQLTACLPRRTVLPAAAGALATCLAVALSPPAEAAARKKATPVAAATNLETLLPRLDRVARLYQEGALNFSCRELIAWIDYRGIPVRERFDYLLVSEEGKMRDFRTDPSVIPSRGAAPREVSPAEKQVPRYLRNGYFWILIFGKNRWPHYRYTLLGQDEVLKRPAVKVGFEPLPPFRDSVNEWEGAAWFDADTSQMLRVEAFHPAGWEGGEVLPAWIPGGHTRNERVVTEFTVEKNGMRFPGLVRVEVYRSHADSKAKEATAALRVEQAFSNYKFFQVRTAEEIRQWVLADDAPPR